MALGLMVGMYRGHPRQASVRHPKGRGLARTAFVSSTLSKLFIRLPGNGLVVIIWTCKSCRPLLYLAEGRVRFMPNYSIVTVNILFLY